VYIITTHGVWIRIVVPHHGVGVGVGVVVVVPSLSLFWPDEEWIDGWVFSLVC